MKVTIESNNLFEKYLRLLGIRRRPPSLESLTELVAAHLKRIPFENISKLYYLNKFGQKSIPDMNQYLNGIEHHNFGGTCYSNNYSFHLLLTNLGYNCKLCGADMNEPDVHLVNIVTLDGHEYIIDTGYAAPFDHPLPRDLDKDYIIALGRDRYVIKPKDKIGNSKIELFRNAQLIHDYTAKPIHRRIEYFEPAITDSYLKDSTFMKSILLVRIEKNKSFAIYNLLVIESEGACYDITPISSRNELPSLIEKHFSIPRNIVTKAIVNIGELGSAWN
jgi:arylamine N-acetyltransferase